MVFVFRSTLSEDQLQIKTTFLEQYRPVIQAATAERDGENFAVTLSAIREQSLERHLVTVTWQADLTDKIDVVETGLPLVYGG